MAHEREITIKDLKEAVAEMIREREWEQFHTPKNLSMNIAAEAAELMEKFLWVGSRKSFEELDLNRQEIEDELADVIIASIAFAHACKIDLAKAVLHKLEEVKRKYPVETAKGRSTKYTKL